MTEAVIKSRPALHPRFPGALPTPRRGVKVNKGRVGGEGWRGVAVQGGRREGRSQRYQSGLEQGGERLAESSPIGLEEEEAWPKRIEGTSRHRRHKATKWK